MILSVFCLLVILPVFAFASGGPTDPRCNDGDPLDQNCPLDSWVYMLVLAPVTVTFVGIYLRNEAIKQHNKDKEEK